MKSPPDRYSTVAVLLHWTIAVLVVWNVLIAWGAEDLKGMELVRALQPHKTIGVTILLLTLARLGWRLFMKPPPMLKSLAPWEHWLARTVHVLFYVVLLGIPLSGWAMVSASKLVSVYPIHLGPVTWPAIAPLADLPHDQQHAVHETLEAAHEWLGRAMIYVLVPLHVLGALKHQFIGRDDELRRMIPLWPRRTP